MSEKRLQNTDYLTHMHEMQARLNVLEEELEASRSRERTFRDREARDRLLLENVHDLIWTMNMNMEYTYISPSVTRIRGFTVAEAMAQTVFEASTPESLERLMKAFQESLELEARGELGDEFARLIEFEVTCKDGSTLWLEGNMTFLRDANGDLAEVLGVARDISKRKQAESAVLAASRMEATATLAGGLAHDFNNLMVSVLGNATLLRQEIGGEGPRIEKLREIEEAAARAGSLAQQALAFARGGKYQTGILDVNRMVQDVEQVWRNSIPNEVDLRLNLDPDLQSVAGDHTQLTQVLVHLCDNAAEAILPGKGIIRVSTENISLTEHSKPSLANVKPGDYVRLVVEDTGEGMPETVLPKIFEPYFTTKTPGRGLGLSAVYGIVKNHNGYVYGTTAPNEGTALHVLLPAVSSTPENRVSREQTDPKGTETILIIDDEEMVLSVTKQILERLGYQVLCASNGEKAVDIARTYEGEIHAAILDLGMPVMDGAEAFPLLNKARPSMKVIICSGFEIDATTQGLLEAGACAFIQKPFRARELGVQIRRAVEQ